MGTPSSLELQRHMLQGVTLLSGADSTGFVYSTDNSANCGSVEIIVNVQVKL